MICANFLIIATNITLPHLPLNFSFAAKFFISGLCCIADIAGKYKAFLNREEPIFDILLLFFTEVDQRQL